MAKIAPRIHPSMACGPPIALTISGMVMNGPTPIMSIMFRAVAPPNPTPRIKCGEDALSPDRLGSAAITFVSLLSFVVNSSES